MKMSVDFNREVDRRSTSDVKWRPEGLKGYLPIEVSENEIPMWIADMDFACFLICLITDIFYIVPDQLPYVGYGLDVQIVLDFMLQIFRLNRKFRLFLHINASDCTHFYPPFV